VPSTNPKITVLDPGKLRRNVGRMLKTISLDMSVKKLMTPRAKMFLCDVVFVSVLLFVFISAQSSFAFQTILVFLIALNASKNMTMSNTSRKAKAVSTSYAP